MRRTARDRVVLTVAALAMVFGAPAAAQADDPPAPAITTLAATNVGTTTAKLQAKVITNNTPTIAYFVYGTAPDQLTSRTPDVSFAPGAAELPLEVAVTQLSMNTKYYVAAVAENDDWIVTGGLETFTTTAPPQILSSAVSDITHMSATLRLNVVTHGLPVTVSGSVRTGLVFTSRPGGRRGGVVTPFGPVSATADGEIAIPLPALEAGTNYGWSAKVSSVAGDAGSSGSFRTEPLIAMPKPTLTPAVATYGTHVTIAGTIPNKPGLVVTLAEQAYPFTGPIGPVADMTTPTDATGAYAFDLRVERPVAYGVTADGAIPLTAVNLTRLKVAPMITAKPQRAKRHRFVVAGRYQPAIKGKVSLYRRGAGRVGAVRTSKGTFRFPARVLKPGKYEVRVTPAVSTGFENAKSTAIAVPRR